MEKKQNKAHSDQWRLTESKAKSFSFVLAEKLEGDKVSLKEMLAEIDRFLLAKPE